MEGGYLQMSVCLEVGRLTVTGNVQKSLQICYLLPLRNFDNIKGTGEGCLFKGSESMQLHCNNGKYCQKLTSFRNRKLAHVCIKRNDGKVI